MNRGLLGLVILILFLAGGLWGAKAMADFHEPLSYQLEQAADAAQKGNLEQATALLEAAEHRWQTHWGKVAILADHTPMDEIDGLFAKLKQYAKSGDLSNFSACCGYLASLISATAEAHGLSWRNLL